MKRTAYAAQYKKHQDRDWRDIRNGLHYGAEVQTIEEAMEKVEWIKKELKGRPDYMGCSTLFRIVRREITVEESVEVPEFTGVRFYG